MMGNKMFNTFNYRCRCVSVPVVVIKNDDDKELSFDDRIEQAKSNTFAGKYKLRDDYQGVDTINPDAYIMEVTRKLIR